MFRLDSKPHKYFNKFLEILADPYMNLNLRLFKNLCHFYKIMQRFSNIQKSPLQPQAGERYLSLILVCHPRHIPFLIVFSLFSFLHFYLWVTPSPFILPMAAPGSHRDRHMNIPQVLSPFPMSKTLIFLFLSGLFCTFQDSS